MRENNRRHGIRSGFTLIELLVVIGIILVLLGILLPVANKIIAAAHKSDTSAQIAKLATAIQFYYTSNGSYPGPIPEAMIWGYNTNGNIYHQQNLPFTSPPNGTNPNPFCVSVNVQTGVKEKDITSSENLVLGLVGGLKYDPTNLPNISYDVNQIVNGNGVRGLNPLTPQQVPAYINVLKTEMSQDPSSGSLVSWAQANAPPGSTGTFDIPEFVDHFPNPMPIIYLRARVGANGIADVVIDPVNSPTGSPWYSMEMAPYWTNYTVTDPTQKQPHQNPNNAPFPSTPVGTLPPGGTPVPPALWPPGDPTNPGTIGGELAFFRNQTLQDNITPRSNGSFILISAGPDGIYGTPDDIIYSN